MPDVAVLHARRKKKRKELKMAVDVGGVGGHSDTQRAYPSVEYIAADMESRLKDNSHKVGWKKGQADSFYLMDKLSEKVGELNESRLDCERALRRLHINGDSKRELLSELRRKVADVANYGMMIADHLDAYDDRSRN